MKQVKRITAALLTVLLIVGMIPFSSFAASENTPKEEVVYINLNADGSVKEIVVVNIFELTQDGQIIDYGKYESLRNMTTTDKIGYSGEMVTVDAKAGKLYCEGRLSRKAIPWNIAIRYYMDGKEYKASEIAGKSGELKISIKITENTNCTGSFFAGYALQTCVTLNTDQCTIIHADGATVANVGKNKQLTYTILPNMGADIEITAKVTDFEMRPIAINGMKLNLAIEIDDTEIQHQIDKILGAVTDLDDGASELLGGAKDLYEGAVILNKKVGQLYSGVGALNSGAAELSDGLGAIAAKNQELVGGAYTAFQGLCSAAEAALNAELAQNGLQPVTLTPETYASVLVGLLQAMDADAAYNAAYSQALEEVTARVEAQADALYAGYIDQNADAVYLAYIRSQAEVLYAQVAAQAVWQQLVESGYTEEQANTFLQTPDGQALVAQAVAAMTEAQKEQILAAEVAGLTEEQKEQIREGAAASLSEEEKAQIKNGCIRQAMKSEEVTDRITAAVAAADSAAASVAALKGQLDNYSRFYEGLIDYTCAVRDAASGANSLKINMNTLYANAGILKTSVGRLTDGAQALYDGATTLKEGTGAFVQKTDGVEAEASGKIEDMITEATGKDVEITSFVSEKNTNIQSVQFVIQTEAIEIPEVIDIEPAAQEKLNFWQKFLRLFGLYEK